MKATKDELLEHLRNGASMSISDQLRLVAFLSAPAMLAQLSYIVMQYIDAAMVGALGANASASIGLVSTTLWLMGGLCGCAATGFYVLTSHKIGANEMGEARQVLRTSFIATLLWSGMLTVICLSIGHWLPRWLGGDAVLWEESSAYFLIFSMAIPFLQMNSLASGMLRATGNLKFPSYVNASMCLLDVVFNAFFIYILGMGVRGAAWGSFCSEALCAVVMLYPLLATRKSENLNIWGKLGDVRLRPLHIIKKALKISAPMGMERILFTGAQIASTVIVAPLGAIALAANSFGITIEALCYMPGYGMGEAATTLVGQSYGAKRQELVRSFSRITLGGAVLVMSIMAVVMYASAPYLMQFMTPDVDVQHLCTQVLRIEAFAEPMYGASIICYYVFVAMGDTLIPCIMNLCSIWCVRITLAAVLATSMGLPGVWLAMCIELCFRGIIFLVRYFHKVH